MEKIYTTKEAAAILSIGKSTILSLIRLGRIKSSNISLGTKPLYRISSSDLEEFINHNKYGERNSNNQKIG